MELEERGRAATERAKSRVLPCECVCLLPLADTVLLEELPPKIDVGLVRLARAFCVAVFAGLLSSFCTSMGISSPMAPQSSS